MLKVVIDTNIFISGLLFESTLAKRVLEKWRVPSFTLVTSLELIQELVDVLTRFKYPYTKELIMLISERAHIVTPKTRIDIVRDKKDNIVLETAQEGEVNYIITDDKDLLVIGKYQNIIITKSGAFLKLISNLKT